MIRVVRDKLRDCTEKNNSLVCCGLDPDLTKMPSMLVANRKAEDAIYEFLKTVVDLTADHVCAYKIQKAFFDTYQGGKELLTRVVHYITQRAASVPTIIDCKIGDIDNTMEAYFRSIFSDIGADSVVLNPYMGPDVWKPLSSYPTKAGVVLVRTSNSGSRMIQEVRLVGDQPLWRHILSILVAEWQGGANLFPVLSSNSTEGLYNIRNLIPNDMPVLLAGVGAQGGSLECIKHLLDSDRGGLMVNSSRALLYPYSVDNPIWEDAVMDAVIKLKASINAQRQ
jgi:orotidine-5'-phosphate decarboxylase